MPRRPFAKVEVTCTPLLRATIGIAHVKSNSTRMNFDKISRRAYRVMRLAYNIWDVVLIACCRFSCINYSSKFKFPAHIFQLRRIPGWQFNRPGYSVRFSG